MTILAKLNCSTIYEVPSHFRGRSKLQRGTFRELTEHFLAEIGWKCETRQLINGRWVTSASRRGREVLKGHQKDTVIDAETDLLVAFHLSLSPTYKKEYFTFSEVPTDRL
ncbi:hypothetical protein [Rhizobium leguminosarum]|uniref:hypothetical protein n=1 Tax=Rhizobium leguminosarum TaxID=384 RepID=UPI00056969BC|nr:hypothetical protein [Rhizobium leguminosarum]